MNFKQPVNLSRNVGRHRTLYVIQSGDHVKVGIAYDAKARLHDLQAGNPLPLRIRMARRMPAALALQVERQAHLALADYAIGREWFIARSARSKRWYDAELGIITGTDTRPADLSP